MVEHDGHVGQLLKKLDDLGIADNTIVVYTTDNGAEVMSWPDGGSTPFKGEKATNWEGGFRVPMLHPLARRDQARHDLQRDVRARGPDPDVRGRGGRAGRRGEVHEGATSAGDKTFKVHLDGYNLIPFFKGEAKESPRKEFLYWSDDGDLIAIRVNQMEGRVQGAGRTPGSTSGSASSPTCARRSSTTSAPTRSSAAPSRSSTTSGWRTGCSSSCRRRPSSAQWLASFKEFPHPAEAGELQPRRGDAEDGAGFRREQVAIPEASDDLRRNWMHHQQRERDMSDEVATAPATSNNVASEPPQPAAAAAARSWPRLR